MNTSKAKTQDQPPRHEDTKPEPIEINVEWDTFGFVATSPQFKDYATAHGSGPRVAAEELVKAKMAAGTKLRFVRSGHYLATGGAR